MRACAAGFVASLGVGFPVAIWDALWLLSTRNVALCQAAFIGAYHVEFVSEVVDMEVVDLIRPESSYALDWAAWYVMMLGDGGDCGEGCLQSQLP